jgi:uncharacterized protein YndB with AHSA1/START domain
VNEISTSHHTIVVKRRYRSPVADVFGAWRDAAALQRWYMPGDATWSSRVIDHDFRVGGRKRIEFGPRVGERFTEDCRYEDIVEARRICFVMTIARARPNARITTSMVTVELFDRGRETELTVTDQLVVLDGGDTSADRERGWGETLDKLTIELGRASDRAS